MNFCNIYTFPILKKAAIKHLSGQQGSVASEKISVAGRLYVDRRSHLHRISAKKELYSVILSSIRTLKNN